jgi:glyoxylase-like metal-dependent hydrolase (beta-lactamase superfamily II)
MEEQSFGPVRFLPGENGGRYPFCHSLYVEGTGVLIDPASSRERLIRLRAEEGVKMVWLSHWHEDHFMHLDLFDDLPLWVSPRDAPPLADLQILLDWYGFDAEERQFWEPLLREQFHFRPQILPSSSGSMGSCSPGITTSAVSDRGTATCFSTSTQCGLPSLSSKKSACRSF